jgi:hypothetical protein
MPDVGAGHSVAESVTPAQPAEISISCSRCGGSVSLVAAGGNRQSIPDVAAFLAKHGSCLA